MKEQQDWSLIGASRSLRVDSNWCLAYFDTIKLRGQMIEYLEAYKDNKRKLRMMDAHLNLVEF